MRLIQSQIEIINEATHDICGEQSNVFLFGSRTDDAKIGGDIDLLVVHESEIIRIGTSRPAWRIAWPKNNKNIRAKKLQDRFNHAAKILRQSTLSIERQGVVRY